MEPHWIRAGIVVVAVMVVYTYLVICLKKRLEVERQHHKAEAKPSRTNDLLYCLRWHENEVLELEKMARETTAQYMANNLFAKADRHERFVKAIKEAI